MPENFTGLIGALGVAEDELAERTEAIRNFLEAFEREGSGGEAGPDTYRAIEQLRKLVG